MRARRGTWSAINFKGIIEDNFPNLLNPVDLVIYSSKRFDSYFGSSSVKTTISGIVAHINNIITLEPDLLLFLIFRSILSNKFFN